MPPHVRRRALLHTAWTHALAFASTATNPDGTPKHPNPRTAARAALPGYLVMHAIFGHRNIYLTPSGLGVIVMYRTPQWGMLLRGLALLAPAAAASVYVQLHPASGAAYLATALVVAAYLALMASLLVVSSFSRNRPKAPRGTPTVPTPLRHVTIGAAAAHPAAPRGEAFPFAQTLIDALPSGTHVVIHPRTPALRLRYEELGFAPSKGLAMVKVT